MRKVVVYFFLLLLNQVAVAEETEISEKSDIERRLQKPLNLGLKSGLPFRNLPVSENFQRKQIDELPRVIYAGHLPIIWRALNGQTDLGGLTAGRMFFQIKYRF